MKARGINDVTKVYEISDLNGGFGGPILRDKLWFYGALRYETLDVSVVDNYYDKNPAPYLYEPDFERPAHDSGDIPNESFRLTWQATSKDKVQFWFTNQNKAREFYNISATVTPDGAGRQVTNYAQPITLKWTRTQTSRCCSRAASRSGARYFDNGYRETVTPAFDIETIQNTPIYAITDHLQQPELRRLDRRLHGVRRHDEGRPLRHHLRHRIARLQDRRRSTASATGRTARATGTPAT